MAAQSQADKNTTLKSFVYDIFLSSERGMFLIVLFLIGELVTFLYVTLDSQLSEYVLFSAAMLGLASCVVGGFFGFIFGIPRDKKKEPNSEDTENTNLQEISDWVTKIIVGVGLVQIRQIASAFSGFVIFVSQDIGVGSHALCGSIIVFYFVVGFFMAYFWAKIDFSDILLNQKEILKNQETLKQTSEALKQTSTDNATIDEARDALVSAKVSSLGKKTYANRLDDIITRDPLNRRANIVRARYAEEAFPEEGISDAIRRLTVYIENKKAANETDDDYADALLNRACYYIKQDKDKNFDKAMDDLKISTAILPSNKTYAKGDGDFEQVKDDPRFKDIVE